jgi:hypothetical protein
LAAGIFDSQAFKTVLLIAVLLVMAGLAFMISVSNDLRDAGVAVAGLIVLIVVVDAFRNLGKKS